MIDKNYLQLHFATDILRRHKDLSDPSKEDLADGMERKKEKSRKRAKAVRESAIFTQRKHQRSLTPGVKIVGSRLLDGAPQGTDKSGTNDELQHAVIEYLLSKGGFQITEENLVDTISKKRDTEDVMDIQIARIDGFHEKWGLDRKFLHKSLYAHRFSDGVVIEHSLISYGGYVSRTYYVVEGNNFRAFAQHNFRKQSD